MNPMNNNSPKTIWRRYMTHSLLWSLLQCLAVAIILYLFPHPAIIVCGVPFWWICVLITVVIQRRKHIVSVLQKDLDPQKYLAVLEYGKQKFPAAIEIIDGSYFAGDHQLVVDLCTMKLQDPKQKARRLYYLTALARVYFDRGLYNETRELRDRIEGEIAAAKDPQKLLKRYSYISFLKYYLKQDYEGCKTFFATLPPAKTKLQQISGLFNRALVNLKTGDPATAKEQFTQIVTQAPKLHQATLAKRYLKAIEAGEDGIPQEPPLTPTPSFTYTPQRNPKSARFWLLALLIILLYTLLQLLKQ